MFLAAACGDDSDLSLLDTTDDAPADDGPADDAPADEPDQSADGVDRSAELVGRWEIINYELTTGG